jgi:flagellar FliL protein
MAKEQEAAEAVEGAPKKGKKKLIIIIAVAVVLLLVLGVVGALLLTGGKEDKKGKHEQVAEEDHGPPIYETLAPITIKLADGDTYLQVEIKLRMFDSESQEKLKEYMPEVRSDILGLLAGKQPDEISTQEGMAKLSDELRQMINHDLKAKEGKGVKKVLFGSFITQ